MLAKHRAIGISVLLVMFACEGTNARRVGADGIGTYGGRSLFEQKGSIYSGRAERVGLNTSKLPDGYVLYWFYRSSGEPLMALSQGGSAPREALETRVNAIADLIHSQNDASGNPLSIDQLKEKIPEVAAIVYIVYENSVVSVGALESFIGQHPFNTAEMGMLATHPDHRGKGLGGIVTTKLSDVGHDNCNVNTFFTVTRVTNYFSLKTQFFKGAKKHVASLKGLSTPVGYGFSIDNSSKIYVVLLSPTGATTGTMGGFLHILAPEMKERCGPLALDNLNSAADIDRVQSSSISKEQLVDQFLEFVEEAASTKEKAKHITRFTQIINEIADWLNIEWDEVFPSMKL